MLKIQDCRNYDLLISSFFV